MKKQLTPMSTDLYKIVKESGSVDVGRLGYIEVRLSPPWNCIFYPIEGVHPYRIVVPLDHIEKAG